MNEEKRVEILQFACGGPSLHKSRALEAQWW